MASTTLSLELPSQEISPADVDASPGGKSAGRWTQEEHKLFLQGLEKYQKQWKLIADLVKTRTVVQIRTHAQKYFQKLQKKNLKEGKLNSLSLSIDDGDLLGSNKGVAPFSVESKVASSSLTSGDGAVTSSEGESDVERQQQRQYYDQNHNYLSQQHRNYQTDPNFQPLSTSSHPLTKSFDGKNRPIGNNPLLLKLAVNGSIAPSTGSRAKNSTPRTKSSKSTNRNEAGSGSAPSSVARKRSREAKSGDASKGNPLRSPKKKSNTGPNTPLSSPGGSLSRQGSEHFGYGIQSMVHDPMSFQQSHMIDGSDLLFPLVNCEDAPTVDEHNLNAHHSELSALGMDGHADQLLDPNIVDLLDRIDWWHSDSVSGINSRSPSPFTDTASSVSSSCGSSAHDLHQAMISTRNALLAAPTVGPTASMGGIAINNDDHATDGETNSADGNSKASNGIQNDTSNLPSTSHDTRSAFSSVINELKFVTKVAQCNSEDHDHISLYNLFQKTNDSATRRLPSMRTLARTLAENQNQYNQQSGIQYSSVAMAAATAARCRLNSVCSQASLDAEFSKFIIEDCGLMRDSTSSTGSDQNNSNLISREEVMNLDGLSRAEDSGNDSPQRRSLSAGVGNEPLLQNPNQLSMLHPMTSMPICPEASALEKSAKTPSSPPRKRGRPRKHPLPVPPAVTTLASSATHSVSNADKSNNIIDNSRNDGSAQMSYHNNEGSEALMYNQHDPALSHEMHIPAMVAFQQAVAEQQEHQQRKPCTFEHYGHTEHEHSGGNETDDFAIIDPFDSFDSGMLEEFE